MIAIRSNLSQLRRYLSISGMGRGALIVFEGLDRSGKTTQSGKLIDKLKQEKIPCHKQTFPDRTTAIGKVINSYLTKEVELEDHAIHLLFTANRWEASTKIRELLESGVNVVIDRYSFSGVVYTAAKKGISVEWCRRPEVGLPQPDLVLFLYTSAEVLASRADYGGERYESAGFQASVLENYVKLKEDYWKEINASLSVDVIHAEIMAAVRPVLEQVADQPIRGLWTDADVTKRKIVNGHTNETDSITRFSKPAVDLTKFS